MNAILGKTNKQKQKQKNMTFIPFIVKNEIGLMFCSGLFIFVPYYFFFSYLRSAKVYLGHLYNDY